jgi:hypothetical protein
MEILWKAPILTILFFIIVGCISLTATPIEEAPIKEETIEEECDKVHPNQTHKDWQGVLDQQTYHPFEWKEIK